MKKIVSLLTLCALILSAHATDYTIPTGTTANSTALPIWMANSAYGSITQQVYLASELTSAGASAGNITAITFHYTAKTSTATAMSRPVKIWLMDTTKDSIALENVAWQSGFGSDGLTIFQHNGTNKGGSLVYDGNLETTSCTTSETKTVTITLDSPFAWDGSKNIVMTVCDMSETTEIISSTNLRFVLVPTTKPRFAHKRWLNGNTDTRTTWFSDLSDLHGEVYGSGSGLANQINVHKYVNKLKFTIVAPTPAPTSPSAGSISTSSAVLSWTAATGAESYEVRYGTTSGSLGAATNVGNVTSYSLSDLEDETTYYYQIRTKIGSSYSAWTTEASFTTLTAAPHIHDITFSKWSSTTSLPTSGDYYLNRNVSFNIETADVTLTGDLNLCLNGKTANLVGSKIIVPSGCTLTLFDNEKGGKITGIVASEASATEDFAKALIVVKGGGTLVLGEAAIENAYDPDGDGSSFAIFNNGTLKLSGAPTIISKDADIYLSNTKVITIESGKPLTNTTPYKVNKMLVGGAFTSGWSNMNGADPSDYFVSADASKIVYFNGTEAALVKNLALSESSTNSSIGDNYNQLANVTLNRSFTSASFNTICLPFALSDAQLTDIFGSDYYLAEFDHSELNGEELYLEFYRREELVAGKPYLIQPKHDVTNPTFEGVTITATSPSSQISDTYISVHGTYAPTELVGGNHNLLFLGANNTLYWPSSTGNIKGFRAYFEVKGSAMGVARRASIVRAPQTATSLSDADTETNPATRKFIQNGELIIECNGVRYNTLGQPLIR